MSQELRERSKRYMHFLKYLVVSFSPIPLWNNFQPKIHQMLNPTEKRKLRQLLMPYFEDKKGICIGGAIFWEFNEYLKHAKQVVNVDIVPIPDGPPVTPDYLTDAANLYFARDEEYDFICSSHVFEHLANPIRALKEWIRVVKKGGIIYCAVPDKRFTFDHKRKRTALQHLIRDYNIGIGLKDSTHLYDVLFNSDRRLASFNPESIIVGVNQERSFIWALNYFKSTAGNCYSMSQPHYHVFTKEDIVCLFKFVGLDILFAALLGNTIHLAARKSV